MKRRLEQEPEHSMSQTAAPKGRLRPVYRELLADLETPLTAYLKVVAHRSCLLESDEQIERVAIYSYIGTVERKLVQARGQQVTITAGGQARTFASQDP